MKEKKLCLDGCQNERTEVPTKIKELNEGLAQQRAYIQTLEEENARLRKAVEFAVQRKQVFADELLEAQCEVKRLRGVIDGHAKQLCAVLYSEGGILEKLTAQPS